MSQLGRDNWLEEDLSKFIRYIKQCDGVDLSPSDLDFEEFLSYLDIEHYLGLRGSATWSSEGNESQIIVKRVIGKIIQENTPGIGSLPDAYYRFAELLAPSDFVITFNYDVVLERALEHVGKSYRLFTNRFAKIGRMANLVDLTHDEVVLLKMHGSVDWFNRAMYEELETSYREQGFSFAPRDPVFEDPRRYSASPILDGPQEPDSPLEKIYRIKQADDFYAASYPPATPWLLSPSASKIVYASPMKDFWYGMGTAGTWHLGVAIIGFSMPLHDEYVRQFIYRLVTNYQQSENVESLGYKKSKLIIVDLRTTGEEIADLHERYRFIDWINAETWLKGFNEEAVSLMKSQQRTRLEKGRS